MVNHMRGWLRRLERTSRRDMLHIPQLDGSVKTFAPSAAREAFLNTCEQLAGEDVPPPHPMVEAATNSADPRWALSFFADVEVDGEPVEDLSDP